MTVTVFTPTHDTRFLSRLAASLDAQTFREFEWLIVPNGPLTADDISVTLPQARVVPYTGTTQNVGELKQFCCRQARGGILVEVDHDDELTPDCLETIVRTFAHDPSADFVYSNCCEVRSGEPWVYSAGYGWEHRPFQWHGKPLHELLAFDPSPASFSKIWYAPNHVRAWRSDFYHRIGGHDPSLDVLDDQDLLARTYIEGNVRKIDRCLYIYHIHQANTCQGEKNAGIQVRTLQMHDKYIESLVRRWCELEGLPFLDLTADSRMLAALEGTWPFQDGTVGAFRAVDLLCKLRSPGAVMAEAYRCLAPNGWFLTETPSTDGRAAFQDPRHVSFWNANSFWYYTKQTHADFIDSPVRFQLNRVKDHFPSAWHEQHQMRYVRADLLKFQGRVPGPVEFERKEPLAPPTPTIKPGPAPSAPAIAARSSIPPSSTAEPLRTRRKPFFTILTPTIERDVLERCCRSVDRQTYDRWQHLVIVDGSEWTHSTAPLFDPRRVFLASGRRHHDVGNRARHCAWDRILGDYVLCLDDDNYLAHDMVLELLSRTLGDADWAVCPIIRRGEFFFHDPPGRRRTDLAQLVFKPYVQGQPIRYPAVDDYDADGMLCEYLKSLCPPRMLSEVGPIVMYDRIGGGT